MRTRSVKIVNEELDEAKQQFDVLRHQAKAIYDTAKIEGREFTKFEVSQFNAIADREHGSIVPVRNRIRELELELLAEESHEQRIIQQITGNQGQQMLRHPSATVYNQMQHNSPERVLPINGIMPGEIRPRYAPYARIGRLKAFHDEQTAFDCGMWYKSVVSRVVNQTIDERCEEHCRNVGLEITNTAYEGSGPAGGYLLPVPISSAIVELREKVGVTRQICNVMPTSGDTLTVPKKLGGLTVYIVPETTAITASDKTWSSISLALRSRKCLSYLSQELSQDSLINLVDNIVSEQAYALALQEDNELCNGDGGSSYGGIEGLLAAVGTAGVYTCDANENLWTEIDIEDMIATVGKLPDRYFSFEPSWLCSHAFFNQVMVRLAFAAGGVTASEVMSGTPNVRSFLGYKVHLTSKMPTAQADSTKCALFGAFDQAVILADRGGIRLQRSDDIKFVEDLIALKAVSRYDMNVHDSGDTSNAGAYVALKTNAA